MLVLQGRAVFRLGVEVNRLKPDPDPAVATSGVAVAGAPSVGNGLMAGRFCRGSPAASPCSIPGELSARPLNGVGASRGGVAKRWLAVSAAVGRPGGGAVTVAGGEMPCWAAGTAAKLSRINATVSR